jgi:glutamine cyclotransferase
MKKPLLVVSICTSLFFLACNSSDTASDAPSTPRTPAISYTIGAVLPHDTSYFTEGFEFYKGSLLESTGNNGKSKLVQYDPATGKIDKQVILDAKYFGEGITVFRDTIYQLTYREGVVHVYNAKDFKKIKEIPYTNGEGWGLTHDSSYLIGTNSGNNLYYYEPGTFKLVKTVSVSENGAPAVNVNELEYINGYIYANQWQYNTILKIEPSTGNVIAKMDLTDLVTRVKAKKPGADVLNGIAYNPVTKKVYITGKYWPEMYELQFAF